MALLRRTLEIAMKLSVTDAQSGFRAYSLSALKKIMQRLSEKGMSVSVQTLEMPAVIRYDVEKPSKKNPTTLIRLMMLGSH